MKKRISGNSENALEYGLFQGSTLFLAVLMFIGWLGTGTFALFMGVIPTEALPARHAASGMGLVMGAGEVIGGFCAPLLGGWAADQTTLAAPIKIAAICAFSAAVLCLFLKETAPVKVGIPAVQPESADSLP